MGVNHGMSFPPSLMKYRMLDPEHRPVIIIGIDITPFKEAMAEDVLHNILMAWLTILLALTGAVSFFWIQNYLNSRKLLQDSRALASEIVRNLPVGMVVISNDGKIRFINDVACSLLAIRPNKTEGDFARSFLPESLMSLHRKISREKPVVEKELNLSGVGNTSVPVNVSTTNIVGGEGQYLGFMFILQNLSELRQLEIKVRQREKLAAIGNLAAFGHHLALAHNARDHIEHVGI